MITTEIFYPMVVYSHLIIIRLFSLLFSAFDIVSSKQILAEADTDSVRTGADDRVDLDHGNYFVIV